MDEKKHDNSQEKQLTPEQQLDLLLEKFLEEPDEAASADPISAEIIPEEVPGDTPEAQLDLLLENLQDGSQNEIPEKDDNNPKPSLWDGVIFYQAAPEEDVEEAPVIPETDTEAPVGILLEQPEIAEQIGPDESALEEAGLTCPAAPESESVVEETAEDPLPAPPETPDAPPEEEIPVPIAEPEKEEPTMSKESAAPEQTEEAPAQPQTEEETTDSPEPQPEEPEEDDEPPKKRRPKNTKAYGFLGIPHLLATFIWLGIIVFIGVGLGKLVWNCAADVLALGRPDSEVTITITKEDDLDSIAQKLKTTGLIQYPSLFKFYAQISDAMDSIRTGTYQLNTLFDYHALVGAMSSNQLRQTTKVAIPEGYTCAQIFRLLETSGVCTAAALEDAAANANLGEYWFLEGLERGSANCLEGYLFPDTYIFYLDHDPVGVLQKFLNNFNKRFNDAMRIKLDTLNMTLSEMMRANGVSEEYIAAHQMTAREVVIIASMIEKETATNPESYSISSVIYNRLTNPNGETAGFLQIDATLVYINGGKTPSNADKQIDSPYNTYLYKGLPAGAISNPGAYSLDAALSPAETAYYFYALDPATGVHHFSKTLKEHNDFLESIRNEEPEEESQE